MLTGDGDLAAAVCLWTAQQGTLFVQDASSLGVCSLSALDLRCERLLLLQKNALSVGGNRVAAATPGTLSDSTGAAASESASRETRQVLDVIAQVQRRVVYQPSLDDPYKKASAFSARRCRAACSSGISPLARTQRGAFTPSSVRRC